MAEFGARWLGWDIDHARICDRPELAGIEDFTMGPRKYGFHGTLMPPFRLAEGTRGRRLRPRLQGSLSASRRFGCLD